MIHFNEPLFSFKSPLSTDENDVIHVSSSSKDCNKWLNNHEKEEKKDKRDDDNYKSLPNSEFN